MAQTRVGIRNGALFNNNSTLWNGLLAYYTGDGTSNDALGNYNGTLINGTTYGTGIINQGFSFDGVNDYVDLPVGTFSPSGDFSISLWIKPNSTGFQFPFSRGGFTSNAISCYVITGDLRFIIANNSTYTVLQTGLNYASIGVWYNMVLTKSATDNLYRFYVNNTLIQSQTITVNPTFINDTMYFGRRAGGSNYYNGILDEVALFNRGLTPTEVTELYNSGAALQYS